ncbi:YchJ family protein [Desulfobotulus mexicanus]|uniref:YchJ family protein n=1 Tax=Desulfobotulus mexicanus TaxID=2586642 RepID=A0A5Q4VHQ5_9BACT|nr:YchJ family protein [Desulfobotulus mexicanus]TYT75710.1 YchJ family protein [Desulfobotulus mexicanus]
MEQCPCGSGQTFDACCEPYIAGSVNAPTAEILMRSRYTAYARISMDYIFETTHPDQRGDYDAEGAKAWAESSQWHGLEILAKEKGLEGDTEGNLEFAAHFSQDGKRYVHHERAFFRKGDDGKWYFYDGQPVTAETVRREGPKVGRNDPCPCGSGKKYKKCCIDNAA